MKYKGKYSLKEMLNETFTGNSRRQGGGNFEEEIRAKTGGVRTGGDTHGHDVEYADGTGLETKTTKSGKVIQIHITHHSRSKEIQAEVRSLGNKRVGTIRQALANLDIDEAEAAAEILANYETKKGEYIMTNHGKIKMSDMRHSSWGSLGASSIKFGPIYRFS